MQLPAFLFLLAQLWFLSTVVLLFHRISARTGLSPLLILLGGLTAGLQLRSLGFFQIVFHNIPWIEGQGSLIFLPVLMLGLLLIYVGNGTSQARFALFGMVTITLLTALSLTLPAYQIELPGLSISAQPASGNTVRTLLASVLALTFDLILLIVAYQWLSNLRSRFPSRLAGGIALLAGVCSDALIYPLLAQSAGPYLSTGLVLHLAGKSLAVLAILPFLTFYLERVIPRLPDSAATGPRPTLDLFTTRLQLEARARYQSSLLHTLSQINQLIIRSNNAQTMLEQAASLLASQRDYALVWIGLVEAGQAELSRWVSAGQQAGFLQSRSFPADESFIIGINDKAVQNQHAVVIKDIRLDPRCGSWKQHAESYGLRSAASFPMRYNNHTLGVLNVYATRPNAFSNREELNLLQELADDLAYAKANIEIRHKQVVLHAAAENMRDGLLITDLRGLVIYANPITGQFLGCTTEELIGKNVLSFVPKSQTEKFTQDQMSSLVREEQFTTDLELPGKEGETRFYSLRAALTRDALTQSEHIVISVRDTTQQQNYERQLLTLNRLTTDLVQILDPHALLHALLEGCKELLRADRSAIYLVNTHTRQIGEVHTNHLPEDYVEMIRQDYHGLPGEVALLRSELVCIEDINETERYRQRLAFMQPFGLRAFMMLPILYQGQALGVLALYYDQPHPFSEEERQLGLTVSHTMAIALQNARLYQAEHSQHQFAEALSEASAVLNSSLDLDEVLDHILDQTIRVLPCRSVNVMFVEGDHARVTRDLASQRKSERAHSPIGIQLPLTLPTLHSMQQTGKAILISDTSQSEIWTYLKKSDWIRSYVAAPLLVRQEVIGFLNMNSDQANFFTEEIIPRLQAFASTAATAIQNARLYRDLHQHSLELEDRVLERTADLSAAKESMEAILASVPDAVFVLDESRNLVETNQAGEILYSHAQAESTDLFSPLFLEKLQASDGPDENHILEVNRRAFQALASTLPLSGRKTGLVIVFRDVTRFRELDQMKTQFVSDVSHELRTPLTNLTIYLDLLSNLKDLSKRDPYLNTLRRETERLTDLIEDLLTISRLEASRVQIDVQPVDIDLLVMNLVQDREPMAASRGLQLQYQPSRRLPRAQADPRLLTQVLSNLLTNALSYTLSGGQIEFFTGLQNQDNLSWLTISVKDTGVGIQPQELEHLFERFFRGSASKRTGASGTGLGLAISKEIIDRLGGKITLQSQANAGSTFTVWLRPVL
jgi:two-component system phosphate regulon sensor histidine kinase PhoR